MRWMRYMHGLEMSVGEREGLTTGRYEEKKRRPR